jgi:hypothetical protein
MEFPPDETAFQFRETMSNDNTTTALHAIKPSTLRVRRYRERRREGVCSFTVTIELSKADITDAIARGRLKSDCDAWNVLDAWYAYHLSDAALEWLAKNKVIKPEQRGDTAAAPPNRVVIIRFDGGMSAVNAWYEKQKPIEKGIGEKYASFQLFGVEGVEQK